MRRGLRKWAAAEAAAAVETVAAPETVPETEAAVEAVAEAAVPSPPFSPPHSDHSLGVEAQHKGLDLVADLVVSGHVVEHVTVIHLLTCILILIILVQDVLQWQYRSEAGLRWLSMRCKLIAKQRD